jgi:uncharacterized protein (DUF1697 family)
MSIYIALLRGVNVGGHRSLPMKELVSVLESLDCRNVRTYIQSGNAVLESDEPDRTVLSQKIAAEIEKRRGFAPHVLTLADLEQAIAENPFPEGEGDPGHLHMGFLGAERSDPDLQKLESLKTESERFRLTAKVFYLFAPDGVGGSKLAASAEKSLAVPLTDRNWTTVLRLRDMARGGEPTADEQREEGRKS